MKRLILYAGPNGAGKSSLRDIGSDSVDVAIDTDRIAATLSVRDADRAALEAGRIALTLFRENLVQGKSISLETTLTGQTIFNRMAEAKAADYLLELRFIALPAATDHIARVAQRVRLGGHDIPAETIIRRYERSLDNLVTALRQSDSAIVLDNSNAELRTLLQIEACRIAYQLERLPSWLESRLSRIEHALLEQRKQVNAGATAIITD